MSTAAALSFAGGLALTLRLTASPSRSLALSLALSLAFALPDGVAPSLPLTFAFGSA